jgi:hypothetical protein
MKATVVAFVLVSVLLFVNAGCGGTPDSEGTAALGLSIASTGETRTTTTSVGDATIGELGERRNPIPVGQEAQVGDWKVRVVNATLDATHIILEENMFNNPPEDGNRYVLVLLEATYAGEESSTFWLDMMYSFVGGKGDAFGTAAVVAPDSITDEDEAFPGASVSGNLVFEVSSDQILGGTLLLEKAFSFDETRLFFAVE